MKGKWAKGIAPRFFAWIIKDKLAVSERPGGYARNHRRVRRQEEILWLRGEGFTRVVSLLTSPHNLHAYDELEMAWANIPFGPHDDPHVVLPDLYAQLREWMSSGERLLVHQEELSDLLMGVVAGYLRWSGLVPAGPQAISVVERIMHRQMGPDGRELVALAPQLAGAGGCPATIKVRAKTSEELPPRPREPAVPRSVTALATIAVDEDGLAELDEALPTQANNGAPPVAVDDLARSEAEDPAPSVFDESLLGGEGGRASGTPDSASLVGDDAVPLVGDSAVALVGHGEAALVGGGEAALVGGGEAALVGDALVGGGAAPVDMVCDGGPLVVGDVAPLGVDGGLAPGDGMASGTGDVALLEAVAVMPPEFPVAAEVLVGGDASGDGEREHR